MISESCPACPGIRKLDNNDAFTCLKQFGHLRKGQRVVIGDRPDARIATVLDATFVEHNFPSQGRPRYRKGYIRFANRKVFDLANQTLHSKPSQIRSSDDWHKAYIFLDCPEIDNLWRRRTLENKIRRRLPALSLKELEEVDRGLSNTVDAGAGRLRGERKPSEDSAWNA